MNDFVCCCFLTATAGPFFFGGLAARGADVEKAAVAMRDVGAAVSMAATGLARHRKQMEPDIVYASY